MERKRVSCSRLLRFGRMENPCHKILCEIMAEDFTIVENEITVKGLRQVKVKCSHCKTVTTIINEEQQ